jgi:hypothetical protein
MDLLDAPRPGAPRTIDDARVDALIARTLESKPTDATHWSSRTMAREMNLSQTAVTRIWRAFGLQPHRQEMKGNDPAHPINGKSQATRVSNATKPNPTHLSREHAEGPLASKNRVQTTANGLDKVVKVKSPSATQPKNSKPDGNVAAALKKRGQKHGTKTLAESAKALYPSST